MGKEDKMCLSQNIIEKCRAGEVKIDHEGHTILGKVLTFHVVEEEVNKQKKTHVIFSIKPEGEKEGLFPEWFCFWINRKIDLDDYEPKWIRPEVGVIGEEDGLRFCLPGETITFYPKGGVAPEEPMRQEVNEVNIEHSPATAK